MTEYEAAVLAQAALHRAQEEARKALAKLGREDRELARREASEIVHAEMVAAVGS